MAGDVIGNGTKEEFLPCDLLIKILKRVPVKSLIRFKCVSKEWMKLLETPNFTTKHLSHSTSNNASLFLHRIPHSHPLDSSFFLIGSDFKVQSLQSIASTSVKIVGSCNGLLLIKHTNNHKILSLWNPATKQVKQVTGTLIDITYFDCIGFGFSLITNDCKIVRISHLGFDHDIHHVVDRAEVYSLTTRSWKEINVINLQDLCIVSVSGITASGSIFWKATTMTHDSHNVPELDLVVSFDIEREVFTLLKGPPPPPSSTTCSYNNILVAYNSKLAMFRNSFVGNFVSSCIDLWVLEDANTCETRESWVKKYTVAPFSRIIHPLCIWKDEIVYCQRCPKESDGSSGLKTILSLFNPYSNQSKHLRAYRDDFYSEVFNYAESLVPVGNIHSD